MEIIREGTSVQEVINMVLLEQGWNLDDVHVVTISEDKGNWFRKPRAVVKFILKKNETQETKTKWAEEECEDWIFFSSGKLYVLPTFDVNRIIIHPSASSLILSGDKPLLVQEIMTPASPAFSKLQRPIEELLIFEFSPDLHQAMLSFKKAVALQPVPYAQLKDKDLHVFFNEKPLSNPDWDLNRVIGILMSNGVQYGIKREAIQIWLNDPSRWEEKLVAAEGRRMVSGQPTHFKLTKNEAKLNIREDGSVNHYGFSTLNIVKTGQVILEVIPRTYGIPGMNVMGNEIPAMDGQEVKIKLGQNVICPSDMRYVYATCDGIIEYTAESIDVSPLYIINGDVDLVTGSIKFNGSVQVNGNVREGMTIQAKDHIMVSGMVSEATLIAGKSIEVSGNVVMSKLIAGYGSYEALNQWQFVRQMNEQLIQVVLEKGASHSKTSLEHRAIFMNKWLEESEQVFKTARSQPWFERIVQWKKVAVAAVNGQAIPQSTEDWLLEESTQLEWFLLELIDDLHSVKLFNSHMSHIYASGDIRFSGKGGYVSTLCCAGQLVATDGEGYLRGGSALAGHAIKVKTVGSPSGAATICSISDRNGVMEIQNVHPGLNASIGRYRKVVNDHFTHCKVVYQQSSHQIVMNSM